MKKAAIPCGSEDSGDHTGQKVGRLVGKHGHFSNEVFSLGKTQGKSSQGKTKNTRNPKISGVFWSCYPDLNRRPHPYQGCALPTELQQRMATRKGLEPSTSGVTGRRSNQLNYRAIFLSKDSGRCNLSWQGQKDSNPRHSVLETDALPAELYP